MNPIKKIWYDNNSEPPKNYIWVKYDKQYEFDVVSRNWKEVASTSSGTGSSGASLSGNLLDDLVNVFTQGEYTKYEDVPIAIIGENPGWTVNTNNTLISYGAPSLATMVIMPNTPQIMLAKDQTYRKRGGIS